MSQENVELVHRLMDAWNHQDIEAILALTDAEAEYVNPANALEPGTRRGHTELVTVFRKQWEGIPGALHEILRLHDRGDEIISEGRLSRTMPGSDGRISDSILMSWKFRDGRIVRLEQLGNGPNFPEALKAAGLSP